MVKQRKFDCHTHIVNNDIYSQYCKSPDSGDYAVVMEFLPHMEKENMPDTSWALCDGNPRLFLCPSIDIHGDIPSQIDAIDQKRKNHPNCRVIGLKIFLTYQSGRADDTRMLPIYEYAQKEGLSVTFHTGLPSLHLPNDFDMDGSNAKYVKNIALKYPTVNFIVAHMDDPRYDECLRIMHGVPNMFSDFSGAFEPGTKVAEDEEGTIMEFAHAIHQFPDSFKQIIYGTDFCPPILLSDIAKYDYAIKKIFTEDQFDDVYWNNPLRAFLKAAQYINMKG